MDGWNNLKISFVVTIFNVMINLDDDDNDGDDDFVTKYHQKTNNDKLKCIVFCFILCTM